ncbi:MAG TPA: sigma-70 family RNA polymerase sigma factor [Niastella sp.]
MSAKEARFLQQMEMHNGILYKICRIYQDNAEDRHDLLQEIMLQLWLSYDSFRGDSQFSSWMYRVAFNTAIVFFKKEKRRQDIFDAASYNNLPEELHTVREQEEQLKIFYKAVQKLNKVEKALIFLYMEGQPVKEIAIILGITPLNVRVRLNRTKDKLKYIIKTMGYEF